MRGRERRIARMNNIRFCFRIVCLIGLALGCGWSSRETSPPRTNAPEQTQVEALESLSHPIPASADQTLLSAAESSMPDFMRDLATLVNIDSGTDEAIGLAQLSELLAQRLTNLGAAVRILSAAPAAGKIVHGVFHGTGTQNIMLIVHFDTVFGKDEAARRPFKMQGNKALGPGVADAKGGVAIICMRSRSHTSADSRITRH